jgi:type I restriction enzyme S subunit
MSVEWLEITLDDVCSKITDGAHHSPKSVDDGLPMASVKDMTPFGLNLSSARKISEDDFAKLVKLGCQPLKNDVLISKDGNSALDTVCRVKDTEKVVLLSSVAILRPDFEIIYPDFLRLYLDAEPTRNYLKSSSISGAAIPRVILKDFKRAKIRLPRRLEDQKKIADTVASYDNLIENNNRRIVILEDMAQSLYREWFVKFRFPGHEDCQFKDSPLGRIPEGWAVKRLDDYVVLQRGFDLPKKNRNENGDIPIYAASGINGYHNVAKVNPPGLVTGRSGTLGVVKLVLENFWPLNTSLWVKEFKNCSAYYGYYLLKSIGLEQFNSGAAVPTLNRNDVHGLNVVSPPVDIIGEFESIAESIFAQIEALTKKNRVLKGQRDLLLPKLISGRIHFMDSDND